MHAISVTGSPPPNTALQVLSICQARCLFHIWTTVKPSRNSDCRYPKTSQILNQSLVFLVCLFSRRRAHGCAACAANTGLALAPESHCHSCGQTSAHHNDALSWRWRYNFCRMSSTWLIPVPASIAVVVNFSFVEFEKLSRAFFMYIPCALLTLTLSFGNGTMRIGSVKLAVNTRRVDWGGRQRFDGTHVLFICDNNCRNDIFSFVSLSRLLWVLCTRTKCCDLLILKRGGRSDDDNESCPLLSPES